MRAELSDGRVLEFPDGTDPAVIDRTVQGLMTTTAPQKEEPGSLENFGVGAVQGVGDVLGTLARSGDYLATQVFGESPTERILGQTPQQIMADQSERFEEKHGGFAGSAGRIGGQLAASLPLMAGAGALAQGAARAAPAIAPAVSTLSGAGGLGSKVAAGALQGGTVAGLTSGASENPEQDIALGAAFGGAIPGVAAAGRAAGRSVREAVRPAISEGARRLAAKADDFGIPINAAQLADTPFLRTIDSVTRKLPFSGARPRLESQQAAFNRAVSRTIGEDTDKITADVYSTAKSRIGQMFERLSSRNQLPLTNETRSALEQVREQATRYGADDTARAVSSIIDDVAAKADDGVLPGRAYQGIDSLIGKISKSGGEKAHFLGQVRDVLRGAMDDAISESDRGAWQTARQQWRNLKTIRDLVAKGDADGNIRPALLQGRVTAGGAAKESVASGRGGELAELAQVGQRFLKDTIPSSGTAERAAVMGAFGGAPVAAVVEPMAFAAGAGLLGGGRAAQSFINSPAYRNFLLQRASGSVPGVGGGQGLLSSYASPVLSLPAVNVLR